MHHIYFKSPLESFRFIMQPEPKWIFNTSTILKVNAEIQLTDSKWPGQQKCSDHPLQTLPNDSYLAGSAGPNWINVIPLKVSAQ